MNGEDITKLTTTGHSDIPRLISGGMDMEVFVIWVDPNAYLPVGAFERANALIDALENVEKLIPDKLEIVRTFDDLQKIENAGKLAAFIGVEGGHPIESSLEKLEFFYDRGMRYLGLTWNNSNDWATSAKDETSGEELEFTGLTEFGKKVVNKCNELRIIVDISHFGEKTFLDAIEISTKPVIASHSSVYNLCPHFRNLKDDQLFALQKNGGVVFVNFYPGYIDSTFEKKASKVRETYKNELDTLKEKFGVSSDDFWYKSMELMKDDMTEVSPTVDALIDHIDYIAQLIGIDHVGLGSDFDGIPVLPKGIEDCTKLPVVTEKLLERGYSKNDVRKILGENFKRVFKKVVLN